MTCAGPPNMAADADVLDTPSDVIQARRYTGRKRRVSPSPRLVAMRTFRPSFRTQMTQETGPHPNGAAAAILAVSTPQIVARAHLMGGYLRRFCHRRNFVRQCSRANLADSPLKT